ncbi:MAG: peptidylprolyl isomerase [Candidatus Pacearchaeota archaeon]|nr:peptidylprolyl isomerase [Candidatus Pacearchaeota archaeon]
MRTRKGDFVELDFIASIKEGNIFDTTLQEEAKKAGLFDERRKHEFKPLMICIGEGMVIRGLDKELEDKEVGQEYTIEIAPKDAFGQRLSNLIKTVPLSAFKEKPSPGMFINVDGLIGKVINVTGGRTLIDLNNPLAGKVVIYKFRINKIIEDNAENIKTIGKLYGLIIKDVKIEGNKARVKLDKAKEERNKEIAEQFKKKVKGLLNLECDIESD